MRMIFATLISLAAMTSAFPADMPVKARSATVAPEAFTWTGFYLGVGGGRGWSRNSFDPAFLTDPDPTWSLNGRGGLFGGYAGYNYQLNRGVVLGLEAAGNWARLTSDDEACARGPAFGAALCSSKVNSLTSVRGRVGLAWQHALVYGAAGWGGGQAKYSRVFPAAPAQTFPEVSTKLSGFSAAGGLEYAFTHNVIGRLQYDFYDFGSNTFAAPAISDTVAVDIKTKVHTVTAGVAWKLDWAALR